MAMPNMTTSIAARAVDGKKKAPSSPSNTTHQSHVDHRSDRSKDSFDTNKLLKNSIRLSTDMAAES